MTNFIKYIHITNFKSISDLRLENCKRINLFIGYPNVGKSNVLEALGLFSIPFLEDMANIKKLVRVENKNELYYNLSDTSCVIKTNLETIELSLNPNFKIFRKDCGHEMIYTFTNELDLYQKQFKNLGNLPKGYHDNSTLMKYVFEQKTQMKSSSFRDVFLPPFGENIIDILSYNPNITDVKKWMKQEFAKFGLEYVLDKSTNTLKVQKRLGNDEVFQLPYSSIADTLQRIIFYKTAIVSNKNSVLLFEEPEANAFPPYIQTVMQDIIDAETNQFFIVTHSPLVVNAFLEYEKVRKETAIYLFDFKDNQTTTKQLSDEEMELVYEYGDALFFNLENLL